MGTPSEPPRDSPRWRRALDDPLVRVALVTAVCLLAEAIIAKNVLDVELDLMSRYAPLWVFLVYSLSGFRDRRSEITFTITIVLVTAAVLVLHAA